MVVPSQLCRSHDRDQPHYTACGTLADMAEHEYGRLHYGGWIGQVFSSDVRGGAMDCFEDRAFVSQIGTGDQA